MRYVSNLISVSALILPLFFCSLSNAATPTIKVGYSPVLSTSGIFIAQEKGYFKEQGLTIELVPFDSSGAAMTPLLAKGELDVGAGNITSGLINAIIETQAIHIVADKGNTPPGNSYMGLIVRTDLVESGRYKTLKDLKGFRIGLTSLGGVSQQILMEKFLEKGGLKPNDVTYIKLSYAEMNTALEKKELDATIQLEPYISMAESRKIAREMATGFEGYPHQQSAAIFFSSTFSKRDKDAVAFLVAYLKGVRDYREAFLKGKPSKNREAIVNILDKYLHVQPKSLWAKMRPVGLGPNAMLDTDPLKNDLKWYVDKGYVTKTVPLATLVDETAITKAVNKIGKIEP